jgi:hypothetical protein
MNRFAGMSQRDRRALLLGAVLLVPGLVWMLGVRPYRASVIDLQDRIAIEQDLLERERGLLESRVQLRASLAAAAGEAGSAGRRLVSASNQPLAETAVAEALEDAALDSRVLLLELRTVAFRTEMAPPPGTTAFRLAVSGEGDFRGFLAFLRTVETHPLLLRVAGVTVDPVAEDEDDGGISGVVEFGMVIEGYARLPEGVASSDTEEDG